MHGSRGIQGRYNHGRSAGRCNTIPGRSQENIADGISYQGCSTILRKGQLEAFVPILPRNELLKTYTRFAGSNRKPYQTQVIKIHARMSFFFLSMRFNNRQLRTVIHVYTEGEVVKWIDVQLGL